MNATRRCCKVEKCDLQAYYFEKGYLKKINRTNLFRSKAEFAKIDGIGDRDEDIAFPGTSTEHGLRSRGCSLISWAFSCFVLRVDVYGFQYGGYRESALWLEDWKIYMPMLCKRGRVVLWKANSLRGEGRQFRQVIGVLS